MRRAFPSNRRGARCFGAVVGFLLAVLGPAGAAAVDSGGGGNPAVSYDEVGDREGTGAFFDAAHRVVFDAECPLSARWYEPSSGRFLSEDPLWPLVENSYAFANNNALDCADPSGLFPIGAVGFEIASAALDSLNTWVQANKCLPAGDAYRVWARRTVTSAPARG